ncbi:hypothetical protein [Rhodococcus coprophilus]|uniref:Uncharacterized protein n=1 Tax=Rhodococcus coprophilus TaxID=38310 RepID=A0A2X4X0Q6_9NOCA|nr:hypothetical protein [Rhodococcus coprophilus]MBM7458574.1 hypothetical protein [Rhodococcus coprophilus]SQI32915.1 Uncharacterised protein [Rhodococcus coprophilus]
MANTSNPRTFVPCQREGCQGTAFEERKYCCYLCRTVAHELENAQRACEALGDFELTNELWAQVVALSDECSRYLDLGFKLRTLAMEAGVTPKQWQDIRRGRVTTG